MELKNLNVVKIVNDTDTQKIESLKALGFEEMLGNEGDKPSDPNIELEKLSYQELKDKATELGLEFSGNISSSKLVSLIKDIEEA